MIDYGWVRESPATNVQPRLREHACKFELSPGVLCGAAIQSIAPKLNFCREHEREGKRRLRLAYERRRRAALSGKGSE